VSSESSSTSGEAWNAPSVVVAHLTFKSALLLGRSSDNRLVTGDIVQLVTISLTSEPICMYTATNETLIGTRFSSSSFCFSNFAKMAS